MENNGLAKLIKSESEWPSLISKLEEEGISFRSNKKKIMKKISKLWYNTTEGEIFKEEWDEKLPGSVFKKNGVTYVIHGIFHNSNIIGERYKVPEEYRETIVESVDDWNLICEEGFKETFSLFSTKRGDVKEMDDGSYSMAQIFPEPEQLVKELIKFAGKAILLSPFLIPYSIIRKNTGHRGKIKRELLRIAKDVKDIEGIRDIRQYLRRTLPPEPLLINHHKFIYGDNPKSENSKYKWDNATLRSAFQAEEMMKFAEEKGINELHALVGFFHEPQIKYFLEHPEIIEEMKQDERYINGQKYIKNGYY